MIMHYKRITALLICILMCVSCFPIIAGAEKAPIKLYIDNVEQKLDTPCFEDSNGVVYIPMKEVFFKMGVYMTYNEKGGFWYGEGNNGEIRITVGSNTADIDWVDVELPAPIREENGVVMIPLYIVEDALKTDAPVYDENTRSIYIKFPDITYKPKAEFKVESVVNDLPEGVDLFREEQLYDLQPDNGAENINYEVVDVEGMPFKKAAQLEMKAMNPFPLTIYSVQMRTIIDGGDFEAGDVGMMTFWARAIKTTDESGLAKLRPAYEQLELWNKAQSSVVDISHEWKKYYLPMYNGQYTLRSGKSHLTFSIGAKAQIIQVADMHLYNYGKQVPVKMLFPDTGEAYKGIEEGALWRKEANRRIEKYRKNDMLIHVTDENGNPVEGAEVSADMTDNEFMLGVAICANEILDLHPEKSRVDEIRSNVIDNDFNTGVCGLEMKAYRVKDDYRSGARMVNEWLSRGKRMRGHALSWDTMGIDEIDGYSTEKMNSGEITYEQMHDYLLNEVKGKLWMFKGTITQWDGLNEPHDSNKIRNKYGTQMFSDIFRLAKAVDPKSKLYVNETGMEGHANRDEGMRGPALLRIVNNMIDSERAPVDGIGVQGHCTRYLYPQGFYKELDLLSKDVDEVSVTEYDFYNTDYTYAPQHLHDTFLATFSHPKSTAFVIWGYYDTMHWRGYGPFYDRQWNPKPEYDEWKKMINEEFSTHETAVTDKNGNAVIRGYRGQYNITVKNNGVSQNVGFTLTNSDNPGRDNYINAVCKDGKIELSTPNVIESYAKNNSENKTNFSAWSEAYSDYTAKFGNKTPVGIYKHTDSNGNSIRETNDGLYNTFWYAYGNDSITYELVENAEKGSVSVDFRAPLGEVYNYSVYSSKDGKTWNMLYSGKSSEKKTIDFTDSMFIKIQSVDNEYMGISEVNINAEND